MKKIDLSMYNEFKHYFIVYDIEIKNISSNKDVWLEENKISPSSYRRARNDGNKIGYEILKKLSEKLSYKMVDKEYIKEIESRINTIYFNTYYRKTDLYENDLKWIDEQLNKRHIIFPIFLLMKLLLIVNSKVDPKRILTEYKSLYDEINKYKEFYNEDLMEIYEIIYISFIEEINLDILSKEYKNEISAFTLSSKCILEGKYIEAIYFAEKAKQIFIKEENAKRVYYINLNLMSAYNYLEKYKECNLLAQKQMYALEAYKCEDLEYTATKRHYMISCLGLGKYQEIINFLNDKIGLTLTEFTCLLISKYKLNKLEYNEYYKSLIEENNLSDKNKIYFELINKLLIKKDKRTIDEIEKYKITKSIIKILKSCD